MDRGQDTALEGLVFGSGTRSEPIRVVAARCPDCREAVVVCTPPPNGARGRDRRLTQSEIEILADVAIGLTDQRIARRRRITNHQVRYAVRAGLAKLGASNRAQGVTLAFAARWLDLDCACGSGPRR